MASVNSTSNTNSIFNLYGIKNNGIGGLASGLDTDSLVEQLTAGTRSKISTQGQKKTLLQWQQTAYRSVATTLRAFQSSRLKASGGDSYIGFNAFFNTYKVTSSSNKISAKESATSAGGSVKIDSILQLASAEKLTSNNTGSITGTKEFDISTVNLNTKFHISLDGGAKKVIDLSSLKDTSWTDADDLKQAIQSIVDQAVGTRKTVDADGKPIVTGTGADGKPIYQQESIVEVSLLDGSEPGKYKLNLSAESNKIAIVPENDRTVANNTTFGLTDGMSNRINISKSVAEVFGVSGNISFTINGEKIEVKGTDSVATMMSKITNNTKAGVKMSYSNTTGQFTLEADKTGAGQNIVLGDDSKGLLTAIFGAEGTGHTRTAGTNAEIVVDGKVISQASNTFDLNGIAFEINELTKDGDDPIRLTSAHDVDGLVGKIKGFVDEYNVLIESLNNLINEAKSTGNYPPLSDEQKAQMTDEQIKTWETEAKKGLLRNDSTLRSIVNDLRTTMNKKVEAAGLSLYDIGIEVQSYTDSTYSDGSFNYSKAGKLVVKEDRLRAAIEQNPDGVRLLFTDQEEGIAVSLSKAVDNAVSTERVSNTSGSSYVRRGSLVRLAGAEGLIGNDTNTISSKIDQIDKYITTLKSRLEKEYSRHWARFSALETAIQRLNAQSSALTDFGS